ncbi:glycoside hydrolase family 28 [Paraburkholderia sp. UYCP14C]|uniref:glycosyl hydrolase family 28 protein n=1 Tax=Paraburkholderia sp. UYCP14C TaxID=2511130 RepID=UPI00101EF5DA|nr:glycosyl hydrolase family 28 protein [Paraburkholderia sp. UYCP14C]RZF28992.1 glycoside hydrolase family 28 [Paraburkholderia sp. UYCP14C]
MKMRSVREFGVLGLFVLTVAGCGAGNNISGSSTGSTTPPTNPTSPASPVWTPGRYAGDTNLPDSPSLPADTQVCSTLQAANNLVKNADGSLPVSSDPTPAAYGGATTALNNPDQARIQAALDACGAAVDAEVGAKITQADQQAAATQQAANNANVNIAGASSETLSNPSYKATKFAVRLVKNSSGAGNAFLSGPLVLPSGVTLWVDDGVTLFASRDVVVYDKTAADRPNAITCGAAINNPAGLPAPAGTANAGAATISGTSGMQNCYPLIRGTHTVNASIMGTGSIDARGYMPLISSSPQYPMIRWATGVTEAFTYSGNNISGVTTPKFSCTNTIAAYRAGTLAPEGTACDVVTAMGKTTLTTPAVTYVVNRQATSIPSGYTVNGGGCTAGTAGCARWVTASWWDISYHGNKDIGGGPYSFQGNPGMLWMQQSKNLSLYQITLRNSTFFTVEADGVDGFTVWGIKIITPLLPDAANQAAVGMNNDGFDGVSGSYSHLYTGATIDASSTGVKNTDGVDPSVAAGPEHAALGTGSKTTSSGQVYFDGYVKNVAIVYNFLSPSDDNVAFKGGLQDPRPASAHGATTAANMLWAIDGNRDVSSNRTYGITVAHNHNYNGHGLSIGSPTNAGVRNIHFYDNYFDNIYDGSTSSTDMGVVGLRIKSGQARGGDVSNIYYDGACMRGVKDFLVFDMYYTGPSADPISYTGLGWLPPSFHDINLSNIRMMNIPANKAASKTGGGGLTFRGLHADTAYANTQSVIQLNLDNVVADKDVAMSIANLSKPVVNIGALDGSTQSKAANATLNLGANVSLIGSSMAHGTGGILTNTSSGAGKYTTPTNTLNLTVNGSDDAGAAGDTDPAATIVSQNAKMQLCDQAASWPVFPNVK